MNRWIVTAAATAFAVGNAPARAVPFDVELGGGVLTPFDRDHLGVFGADPILTIGAGMPIADGPSRAFLDFTRAHGEGTLSQDPTFDLPGPSYTHWAIHLGLDRDLVRQPESRLRIRVGAAWQTSFVTLDDGVASRATMPAYGPAFDFRPLVRVSGFEAWIRYRLQVLSNARFEAASQTLNLTGTAFQLGVRWNP